MTQYIPKEPLVAEIERLISNGQVRLQESQESNDYESYVAWAEHIATCIKVLSLLDTLEVKEVDLKEEVERFAKECGYKSAATIDFQFAKHFFELGMQVSNKAQKGG